MFAVRSHEVERLEIRRRNPQKPIGGDRLLMPATHPAPAETSTTLRRVPKLAVRNRVPEADTSPNSTATAQEVGENGSPTPLSDISLQRNLPATLERRESDQSYATTAVTGVMETPAGSSQNLIHEGTKKKKKTSGVLGFLTLKEPSTSAWEEYAQQQKKTAAAQKGARTASVAMPGVSLQKLPEFVPKTNSAWDGLPDTTKRASIGTKSRSNRVSTISSATRHSNRSGTSSFSNGSGDFSPARKYGSLSSKPPRPQSASTTQTKRESVQTLKSVEEPRAAPTINHPAPLKQNPVTPWDEPEEPEGQSVEMSKLPESSPETFLHPPSPPPVLFNVLSQIPSPGLDLQEIPPLEDCDPTLPAQASPTPSPLITPVYEHSSNASVTDEKSIPDISIAPLGGPVTFWNSDTDTDEPSVGTSQTSTPRKAPFNFSRPRLDAGTHRSDLPATIEETDEESNLLQPTLRDDTGRTSPFLFDFYDSVHASDMSDAPSTPHLPGQTAIRTTTTTSAPHIRADSTCSQMTCITTTTITTIAPALQSPTFSSATTESTRPSTAASQLSTMTTTTTCRARRSSSPSSSRSHSPARSNSDAGSLAPSVMSVQWTMSPKERLGLGGRVVRRDLVDVMPWEEGGQREARFSTPPAGSRAAKRVSIATVASQATTSSSVLGGGETGKLKRLSMRLGGRR